MSESLVEAENRIALPLLPRSPDHAERSSPVDWHGWRPIDDIPDLADSPEPLEPQGEYGAAQAELIVQLPLTGDQSARLPAELLAPAGGPEAGYAAFHFGADAIYLGLKKFSARAEAENFTLQEVDEITAYAHSLQPRRRVFVTINTLIRQDEIAELVADVAALADIGVDALIIQDLGVYHLVRTYFPSLELHASTQLAVHNRAGAATLQRLGFHRVVLARELTFEEVRDITNTAGIETEVFIHGALCYSYSGLCLFSAQTLGRSGNRGKCAYSCRDAFEVTGAPQTLRDGTAVKRDPGTGFPFSMKDLALPDHLPALRNAGVSCFKVEGRKKSPLYVATTTEYYRKLLDDRLTEDERPILEADMQTVFSRPWTRLFVQSHKDKEVADRDTVGHRGTLVGEVEAVHGRGTNSCIRFRTRRTLERHDGLQIDLPILGKPYGFAVDRLWTVAPGRNGQRHEVFQAPSGALVEVGLPPDHPVLPVGAPVYCSSSQAVKQKYRYSRPKPGHYRVCRPVRIEAELTDRQLTVCARIDTDAVKCEVRRSLPGPFTTANDPVAMTKAIESTFAKLGDTHLELAAIDFSNDSNLFIPVSRLNRLRRELLADLESQVEQSRGERIKSIQSAVAPRHVKPVRAEAFRWSIKVDRIGFLDEFVDADFVGIDEVIVDIARDHPLLLQENLEAWANKIGREHIRLALPPLTRSWEDKGIRHKIHQLRAAGWNRWEAGNLSAWSYLDIDPLSNDIRPVDLATDWSVYVINRLAAQQLLNMGVSRFTLSPEDGLGNIRSLLAEFSPRAVLIVHQDTPLFLAESCAYANLIGGCPGKANCKFESMEMESTHGEKVTALDYHCRTIVLNQGAFCLSTRLQELAKAGASNLRADFIYRKYEPAEVRERWRLLRAGKPVPGGQAASFDRGIL